MPAIKRLADMARSYKSQPLFYRFSAIVSARLLTSKRRNQRCVPYG